MRIDDDDPAVDVDDHHAVGRRLQKVTNLGPHPFGMLAGDVGSESAEETHKFPLVDYRALGSIILLQMWDQMIDDLYDLIGGRQTV